MNRSRVDSSSKPGRKKAPDQPATDAGQRIIKKYPNRRLYDTQTSAYVTLTQVRDLVMERAPFMVVDTKTGEDITRSILLQIILEEEAAGAPMFSEQVLADIIRFYGHTMQGFMRGYLEKSVQGFVEIQAKLAEHAHGLTPEMWAQLMQLQSPLIQNMMGSYLEQSKNLFLQTHEQMARQADQVLEAFGIRR